MNSSQLMRLCASCNLGAPLGELQMVPGGLLHRMWRLTTTQGSFAVKQLNPSVMQRPHMRDTYRLSERIAAAMAARGVPAVVALDCAAGDPLQEIDDTTVMVYPWLDGEILPFTLVDAERAKYMGKVLAQMHALNLQFPELPLPQWERFPADDWDMLTIHAYDQGISWAYPVRAAIPQLIACSQLYEEAGAALSQLYVVSHRDLDQKNVLWRDERTPLLLDWEAAGLVNPTMELLGLALDWSGLSIEAVREDIFAAVIKSYVAAGGVIQSTGSDALHGVMGVWLGWLLFNMRRSLGESATTDDERQTGVSETMHTLARLRLLARHAEQWAGWIDALR